MLGAEEEELMPQLPEVITESGNKETVVFAVIPRGPRGRQNALEQKQPATQAEPSGTNGTHGRGQGRGHGWGRGQGEQGRGRGSASGAVRAAPTQTEDIATSSTKWQRTVR